MQSADLWEVCRLYSDHLECVAFFGLPKYYHTGPYPQRVDAALVSSKDFITFYTNTHTHTHKL